MLIRQLIFISVFACSDILVTRGASRDNCTYVGYNADSPSLLGELYHWPRGTHPKGSKRKIIDWDGNFYLMDIPEASTTYNVIGNINEYQLAIGETTFGGLASLTGYQPGIDYGSLIYVTLQRAKDAREAIKTMTSLVAEHGYHSSGESFSIADGNEVWLMEMIGRGPNEKGAIWVAIRIPDGYISAHSNQARIQKFIGRYNCKTEIVDDTEVDCFYIHDVVDFCKNQGLTPDGTKNEAFSFSDTVAPLNFEGARMAEARTWSFFRQLNSTEFMEPYLAYINGSDLRPTSRMPLFVKPKEPVELATVQKLLGDHFDDSALEFRYDIGAGPYSVPYRWRPLTWNVSSSTSEYFNERSAGTQQTGWTFVAESRKYLPDHIGGRIWWAADDAATTVYAPFYCHHDSVPSTHGNGSQHGDASQYQADHVFWVFNLVANWAYTRYEDMFPLIAKRQDSWRSKFAEKTKAWEDKVQTVKINEAVHALTKYSNQWAKKLVADWQLLFQELFSTFRDGFVIKRGTPVPDIKNPGYSNHWYDRIVKETGDRYKVPDALTKRHEEAKMSKRTGL